MGQDGVTNTTTMVRKRPHRKVRSGCYRCKSKKVKCDERKPRCSHCERYSAECNYPPPPAGEDTNSVSPLPNNGNSPAKTYGSSPKTNGSSPHLSGLSPYTNNSGSPHMNGHVTYSASSSPRLSLETTDLNITDLELMHHWTTSAHAAFGDLPQDSRNWQVDIPQLAMQHPFLMHGLLSISSLHLSILRPANKERYLLAAAHHQNLALPPYLQIMTDIRNNLNEENCHPLLAYASFTVAYSLAYPKAPDHAPSPVPEWFAMLRGPRDLVSSEADYWSVCAVAGPWLMKGPMAFQLRQVEGPIDISLNPDDEHLQALEPLLQRTTGTVTPGTYDDFEIYRTTLSLLREHFAIPYMPNGNIGIKMSVFQLVEKLPEQYLHLLRARQPEALVLLAHLCVLMKKAENYWFLEGAAEGILNMVNNNLDDQYKKWIAWPYQKIWDVTMCR